MTPSIRAGWPMKLKLPNWQNPLITPPPGCSQAGGAHLLMEGVPYVAEGPSSPESEACLRFASVESASSGAGSEGSPWPRRPAVRWGTCDAGPPAAFRHCPHDPPAALVGLPPQAGLAVLRTQVQPRFRAVTAAGLSAPPVAGTQLWLTHPEPLPVPAAGPEKARWQPQSAAHVHADEPVDQTDHQNDGTRTQQAPDSPERPGRASQGRRKSAGEPEQPVPINRAIAPNTTSSTISWTDRFMSGV